MNNVWGRNIIRFVVLILLQVLVLNHVDFMGYINPYLYIVFILFLPMNIPLGALLVLSFITGLTLDIFEDSGGIHACACLVIAYLRPFILSSSFGLSYKYQSLKFFQTDFKDRFTYVVLMIFIHHLVLFTLMFFSFEHWLSILENTLFSGIFTLILTLVTFSLFRKKER